MLLDAIKEVESNAVGDDGDSLGAFRIKLSFWTVAVTYDPSLTENGETHQDVTNETYARMVITAYMNLYATVSRIGRVPKVEDVVRIFRGGPDGWKDESTTAYWLIVCPAYVSIAIASGDPHFCMWDKTRFSYHGECDLVLVHVPNFASGSALNVHLRTKIKSDYSVITDFAIGIGSEILEVAGKWNFRINGIQTSEPPAIFAGFPIEKLNATKYCKRKDGCPNVLMFKIDLGFHGDIVLTCWKDIVGTSISASKIGFPGAVGLAGKWGVSGMFSRDGTKLENSDEFGREWQVRDTEPRLFHENREPQYPTSCRPPPKLTSRRFEADSLFYKEAQDACSHRSEDDREMCLFDVLATGDLEFAYVPF